MISSNTRARRTCSARRGRTTTNTLVERNRRVSSPIRSLLEKLEGTNVGIHFTTRGRMVSQCPGHEITEGMHPQYDLFKHSLDFEAMELAKHVPEQTHRP